MNFSFLFVLIWVSPHYLLSNADPALPPEGGFGTPRLLFRRWLVNMGCIIEGSNVWISKRGSDTNWTLFVSTSPRGHSLVVHIIVPVVLIVVGI